jgi:hypothetical protein
MGFGQVNLKVRVRVRVRVRHVIRVAIVVHSLSIRHYHGREDWKTSSSVHKHKLYSSDCKGIIDVSAYGNMHTLCPRSVQM